MKRNDVHSPSNIKPEDYEYVAQQCAKFEGIGSAEFILAQRRIIEDHMKRTGGVYSGHEHGGNCDICGSVNAVYNVLFYHTKTNTYVSVGQDCALQLDAGQAPAFKAFRKRVGDYREAQAGKRKAQLLLADAGHSAAWELYIADGSELIIKYAGHIPYEEMTIRNIVGKLVKYGSISEKAMNYVAVLLSKINNRAVVEAKKAEEAAKAANAPTGRVQVTGVVLTVKFQESDFGTVQKMLVKDDSGFKVWVTVPAYSELKREQRVSFKATLTPSQDDPKFAFGKRPVMAKGTV